MRKRALWAAPVVALAACGPGGGAGEGEDPAGRLSREAGLAWERAALRIEAASDSIEDALKPVPFLRPTEEAALRRYPNDTHVARARSLGISPGADSAALRAFEAEGTLVALPDSTEQFVLREMDHSVPLVTPDVRALLDELGRRFQARLDSLGLPPFRIEITSGLRTAASQDELRDVNPNAAAGTSSHQFGTTVDVAYAGYAAPGEPMVDVSAPEAPWLEPWLVQVAASVAERAAARKSGELKAVLGRVLEEMQDEGKVLVTLERQQPVYHITVARRLASSP